MCLVLLISQYKYCVNMAVNMAALQIQIIVVLIIVLAVAARKLQVQTCAANGILHAVKIRPCRPLNDNGPDGCKLRVGSQVTMKIKFTPHVNSTVVRQEAYGKIFSLPVPFPGFASDACGYTSCPMRAGRRQLYHRG